MSKAKNLTEAQEIIDTLTASNEKLSKENAALKTATDEKDQLIASLRKESVKSKNLPTFENGNDTYEVLIAKAKFEGVEVTDEEIVRNSELQNKLIKIGASVIRKVIK